MSVAISTMPCIASRKSAIRAVRIPAVCPPSISIMTTWRHLESPQAMHMAGLLAQNPESATSLVAEVFGYDARGEITDYYQEAPSSGNWYHVQQSYDGGGQRVGLQGFLNDDVTAFTHNFWYDFTTAKAAPEGLPIRPPEPPILRFGQARPTTRPVSPMSFTWQARRSRLHMTLRQIG